MPPPKGMTHDLLPRVITEQILELPTEEIVELRSEEKFNNKPDTAPSVYKHNREIAKLDAAIKAKLAMYDCTTNIYGDWEPSDNGYCELVYGLPCTSRRKETELRRTWDKLVGTDKQVTSQLKARSSILKRVMGS